MATIKPLKIALDYDHTYTEDKFLWRSFALLAAARGHEIKFVTFRMENRPQGNADILGDAASLGVDVIFCNGETKASVYPADIWIDDSPELIPTAEQLALVGEIKGRVLANQVAAYEGPKNETAC